MSPRANPSTLTSLIAALGIVSGVPDPERAVGDMRKALHERALAEDKIGDSALGNTPHPENGELDQAEKAVDVPPEHRDAVAELLNAERVSANNRALEALLD